MKDMAPLAFPALAVRILNVPLDVDPFPLVIETEPPVDAVAAVLLPAVRVTRPPVPDSPLPATMLTEPPAPLLAEPVVSTTEPLLPVVLPPDLNINAPLTPNVPAFAVRKVKAPLLFPEPNPVTRDTDPPLATVLPPALMEMRPPVPEVPSPTATLTLPPAPLEVEPVCKATEPLLPEAAVPVLKESAPLVLVVPAFAVLIENAPLDSADPYPLVKDTEPPVAVVLTPPRIATRPPAP